MVCIAFSVLHFFPRFSLKLRGDRGSPWHGKMCEREGVFIQLHNYSRPYHPGERVIGEVIVCFNNPQRYLYLSVKLEGKAEVSWSRQIRGTKSLHRVYYRDVERYFTQRIKLLGDQNSETLHTLAPGNVSFPFDFTLPEGLPSSFRGFDKVGSVQYLITARLKKPWFNYDIFTILPVHVVGAFGPACLNLKNSPELLETFAIVCRNGNNSFWRFDFARGTEIPKVDISKRIFCPGEKIIFALDFSTECTIHLKLFQVITYKAKRKSRRVFFEIAKTKMLFDAQSEISLQIPSNLVPTKLGGLCKLIDVRYYLKVEIIGSKFPRCWKHWKGKVPLHIVSSVMEN